MVMCLDVCFSVSVSVSVSVTVSVSVSVTISVYHHPGGGRPLPPLQCADQEHAGDRDQEHLQPGAGHVQVCQGEDGHH